MPKKGYKQSEEHKRKISESNEGHISSRKGVKLSNEIKEKISENHADISGKNNPMYGKIGENSPNFGKSHSQKTIEKLRIINLGENNPNYNEDINKWIEENVNKHLCECNCGQFIKIERRHYNMGIPKYINGHFAKGKNNPCYGKFSENNPNWRGGVSFGKYCPKFNEKKKEEIREQYNRICQYCGKHEKDNIAKNGKQRKLSVHHVDSDKEQGCNGKPWKLIPFCMTCHGKMYKNQNKIIGSI